MWCLSRTEGPESLKQHYNCRVELDGTRPSEQELPRRADNRTRQTPPSSRDRAQPQPSSREKPVEQRGAQRRPHQQREGQHQDTAL